MQPSSAVRRSSLRQQLADAIRDEILAGRLPAGGRFTVKEIAEHYGVSATPVREALVDLSAQGLLDVEHHRGFQVRTITWGEYRGMVEARSLVTEGVFRNIVARGMQGMPDDTALASVRRRGAAASAAARGGELDVLIGCDLRFWRELTVLIRNRPICDFLDRLRTQIWMYSVPHLRRRPDLGEVCWQDHTALADAVCGRDLETIQRLVGDYNDHAITVMARITGNSGRPGPAPGDGPETGDGADAGDGDGCETGDGDGDAAGTGD
ncbi:GntR family transcriptional regulator [Streptomyces sp. NPDC059506]|uniref:GntR family transcriptional regulator n=1 Tax=Streptomyces TaxID=1883 RepID=UPI003699C7BC